MRAIDADALKDNMFGYVPPEMTWNRGDIEHKIDEMPTVPAIPVEWIVNLKNEYAREGREQAEGDLMNLLLMWQKEQEAR